MVYCFISDSRIHKKSDIKGRAWLALYLAFSFATFLTRVVISAVTMTICGEVVGAGVMYRYNSITVFCASICLFLHFLWRKEYSHLSEKIIKVVSPLIFGVYLIHDNPDLRNILWGTLVNTHSWIDSPWFVFILITSVFTIFVFCCFVEKIRCIVFKTFMLEKLIYTISIKLVSIVEKLCCIFTSHIK